MAPASLEEALSLRAEHADATVLAGGTFVGILMNQGFLAPAALLSLGDVDELRSLDWVPRSVRTRARQIERAIATLEKELMRAPTDAEIAQKLGLTGEELEESLHEISRSSVAALDELWSPSGTGDQIAVIDTIEDESGPSPELSLEQTEIKEALADSVLRWGSP